MASIPACITLLLAATAQAGVVRGIVLEYASGRPLARTQVGLQPVSGGKGGAAFQTRAGRSGDFSFVSVPAGLYLLTSTRDGYFPAAHGQRRPYGQGTPIEVTRETNLFTELRMRRKGAITGRVLDENDIGIAKVRVVAYRAQLPLRSAGNGISDDRGIYRIYDLEPGKYWVRSAEHVLEDGSGRLPTFGPESQEPRDARPHVVRLEEEAIGADLRPMPGNLFALRGAISCMPAGLPVTVALSSETGLRQFQTSCSNTYRFENLAPAAYEVFATTLDKDLVGFIELTLGRDYQAPPVELLPPPDVMFMVQRADAASVPNVPIRLTGRRLDLSETGSDSEIKIPRTKLAPGYWEIASQIEAGSYVESISDAPYRRFRPRRERAPDRHDVLIAGRMAFVTIQVSGRAARIEGSVTREDKGVAAAPVFLWPVTESARRSLNGWRQVLAGADGRFRFEGLPPGDYRMLATFDAAEIDQETLDQAQAAILRIEPSQVATVNLTLWMSP